MSKESLGSGEKSQITIIPLLQREDYDCGQTCLDMLGYEGRTLFPQRSVESQDFLSIAGAKSLELLITMEEELDYDQPIIWVLMAKGQFTTPFHCVIRYKDQIYCPTIGQMDAKTYK